MFGPAEIAIILVIVLIVFGAGKLPSVMKDVGKGVKSFKDAVNDSQDVDALPGVTKQQAVTAKKLLKSQRPKSLQPRKRQQLNLRRKSLQPRKRQQLNLRPRKRQQLNLRRKSLQPRKRQH